MRAAHPEQVLQRVVGVGVDELAQPVDHHDLVGRGAPRPLGGEVLRQFPFPYGLIACGAVYLISGISAYTFGRIVLASLARFIP